MKKLIITYLIISTFLSCSSSTIDGSYEYILSKEKENLEFSIKYIIQQKDKEVYKLVIEQIERNTKTNKILKSSIDEIEGHYSIKNKILSLKNAKNDFLVFSKDLNSMTMNNLGDLVLIKNKPITLSMKEFNQILEKKDK